MSQLDAGVLIGVSGAVVAAVLYLGWLEDRRFVRLALFVAALGFIVTMGIATWDMAAKHTVKALLPYIEPNKRVEAKKIIRV